MTWTLAGILLGAGGGTLIGDYAGSAMAGIGVGIAVGGVLGFIIGALSKRKK